MSSASLGFDSYWDGGTVVDFNAQAWLTPLLAPNVNTSGFVLNIADIYTGIYAQQSFYSFRMAVLSAAALAVAPVATAKYFTFSSDAASYYLYYIVDGNGVDPAIAGRTGIRVNLLSAMDSSAVAYMTRNAVNGLQMSTVSITNTVNSGDYWQFFCNPSAVQNHVVWYSINGVGSPPSIPGAIYQEVKLDGTEDEGLILDKTMKKLNTYQFNSPNFIGLFLRGRDPNEAWDKDTDFRIVTNGPTNLGPGGEGLGTLEYQQILNHVHPPLVGDSFTVRNIPSANVLEGGNDLQHSQPITTGATGGSETRPVNTAVNFYIKY